MSLSHSGWSRAVHGFAGGEGAAGFNSRLFLTLEEVKALLGYPLVSDLVGLGKSYRERFLTIFCGHHLEVSFPASYEGSIALEEVLSAASCLFAILAHQCCSWLVTRRVGKAVDLDTPIILQCLTALAESACLCLLAFEIARGSFGSCHHAPV